MTIFERTPSFVDLMARGVAYLLFLVSAPSGLVPKETLPLAAYFGLHGEPCYTIVAQKQEQHTDSESIKTSLQAEFERLSWTCGVRVRVESVHDTEDGTAVTIALAV